MVPKNLTTEQKANRGDVCLDLLDRLEREPEFFSRVIIGDESWILEYNPETKHQSREWHTAKSPHPKKARMSKSKIKSMFICFFDSQGIVHKEFVPAGQIVNQTFYWEVLERLRKRVACVLPSIARIWMLHHDNAPCHTAVSINEFLQKKAFLWFLSPPIHWISVPVTSFYTPAQKALEREPFWYFGLYPEECNWWAERLNSRSLLALLRAMDTMPPSLWNCPRELFWRG